MLKKIAIITVSLIIIGAFYTWYKNQDKIYADIIGQGNEQVDVFLLK
jgi:hypothetical protein